jgi:hypothetical protein
MRKNSRQKHAVNIVNQVQHFSVSNLRKKSANFVSNLRKRMCKLLFIPQRNRLLHRLGHFKQFRLRRLRWNQFSDINLESNKHAYTIRVFEILGCFYPFMPLRRRNHSLCEEVVLFLRFRQYEEDISKEKEISKDKVFSKLSTIGLCSEIINEINR